MCRMLTCDTADSDVSSGEPFVFARNRHVKNACVDREYRHIARVAHMQLFFKNVINLTVQGTRGVEQVSHLSELTSAGPIYD